jgi:small subunit ribosomal protein S4e
MSHLKRQKVPKKWPIPRKGTKYVVRPSFGLSKGIPLLVLLRDMLKIAQNRKEVKRAIHLKHILVNGIPAKDEKTNIQLFDKVTIVPTKTYYKLNLSGKGKFDVEKIKEVDANQKVAKIVNKKILKGKKVQLNLSDGRNYLSDLKCSVNDSVSIDFKKKKISKCLPLKEKAKIVVIAGKHSGERGTLKKIKPERKMVALSVNGKEVNILIKQIMVTD